MAFVVRLTRRDPSVPWGFRMRGGLDCGQPLIVSNVSPGGLGDCCGLQTGVRILSIGGDSTESMTNEQAKQAVIRCSNDLELEIGDPRYQNHCRPLSTSPSRSIINGPPASHSTLNIDLQRPCPRASPPCSPKPHCDETNFTYKPLTSSPTMIRKTHTPCSPSPSTCHQPRSSFRHWQIPKPSNCAAEKPRCYSSVTVPNVPSSPPCPSRTVIPNSNGCTGKDMVLKRSILRTDCAKQRPICFACNSVIQGPYVDTMDHCFCPNHFKCTICCALLNERSFAEHEGKYYCEADFAKFIAPKCAKCYQPIIGEITKALNKNWHPHCFTCFCCGKPLKEKFYAEDGDKVLCEADWKQLHTTQCGRCKQPISEIDRFVEAFDQQFHARCFCCAACQVPLDGKPFHARDNKPFCRVHAHAVALYC